MKPLVVEQRAADEIDEIVNYYEDTQEGLGIAFQLALKSAFQVIRRSPDAFGYNTLTKCRTYKLKRFPHIVHYRHEEHAVLVMAVAHPKRQPGYWL